MFENCGSCFSSGAIRRYQVRGKIPFDPNVIFIVIKRCQDRCCFASDILLKKGKGEKND